MATTTNYGWTTPDNAGLVKNGASDIRSIGQSVDTFLNRPLAKNPFYNSAFDIWQRGTSFTANGYMADRWYGVLAGIAGRTISRVAGTGQFQYMTRIQRTAGNTATNGVDYGQSLEIADATLWAGKTVTLSFYARKGADYSAASSILTAYVFSGTSSTETNRVTTAYPSGGTTAGTLASTLTTTLQRFQTSFTFGSTVTQFALVFSLGFAGTAGAADYVEITGVQLEESTQASPYQRQNGTIQGELAACQRYYYRMNANAASNFPVFGWAFANTTSNVNATCNFPVTMRTKPTAVDTSAVSNFSLDYSNTGVSSLTTIAIDSNYTNSDNGTLAIGKTAGFILGQIYRLSVSSSVAAYIGWSAEL